MANTLAPSGFVVGGRPSVLGAAPTWQMGDFQIPYNYATPIAKGDPVVLVAASGMINIMATAGTSILGIFQGCEYYNPAIQQYFFSPSWPGVALTNSSIVVRAKVIVDPFAEFIVQVNGGPATQANVGNTVDITASSSGVPNAAGISTCSLLGSSLSGSSATQPFKVTKIVGLTDFDQGYFQGVSASYNPTTANNFVLVKMNTSQLASATAF